MMLQIWIAEPSLPWEREPRTYETTTMLLIGLSYMETLFDNYLTLSCSTKVARTIGNVTITLSLLEDSLPAPSVGNYLSHVQIQ